jgi:hypothetical protein
MDCQSSNDGNRVISGLLTSSGQQSKRRTETFASCYLCRLLPSCDSREDHDIGVALLRRVGLFGTYGGIDRLISEFDRSIGEARSDISNHRITPTSCESTVIGVRSTSIGSSSNDKSSLRNAAGTVKQAVDDSLCGSVQRVATYTEKDSGFSRRWRGSPDCSYGIDIRTGKRASTILLAINQTNITKVTPLLDDLPYIDLAESSIRTDDKSPVSEIGRNEYIDRFVELAVLEYHEIGSRAIDQ